jgi:hypothetical protein
MRTEPENTATPPSDRLPGDPAAAALHGLVPVELSPADQDGRLRDLLQADLQYQRRQRERARSTVALILAGILPAISLVWPAIPLPVRVVSFLFWSGLLAATLCAWAAERRWRRRILERAGALQARGARSP